MTVDANGTELNVLNFQGVWDLDGDNDSAARLRMSDTVVQAVKGKTRVILGGDTNVRPMTETVRRIERHLHNIFGTELTTTFNMNRKSDPGYATAVVDMIFVSDDFTVTSHECPSVDISDHLPLVVELEY